MSRGPLPFRFLSTRLHLPLACGLVVVGALLVQPPASATELWPEHTRLEGPDIFPWGNFGRGVSIDGDTAMVGARWEFPVGAVHVFQRTTDGWLPAGTLDTSDLEGAQFGISVSLSGDSSVVGANLAIVDELQTGAAYVYARREGAWFREALLVGEDTAEWDNFGIDVDMDGNTVIVGATNNEGEPFETSGAAYVFVRNGESWSQQAKLVPEPRGPGFQFGRRVSVDSGIALVGAPYAFNTGAGYIFARDGEEWLLQAVLRPAGLRVDDRFGFAVSLSGERAVVGATGNGTLYVYERIGGAWTLDAVLTASDADAGAGGLAYSVSMKGDRLVTGVLGADGRRPFSGAAYLFHRTNGSWAEIAKLISIEGISGNFAGAVSTDGASAIVGADMYDRERGAAYLFDVVEPPGPVELLEALARAVVLFAAEDPHGSHGFGAGESRPGYRDSLLGKIDLAIRALEESGGDDSWPAVRVMESFIHAVEARRGRFILDADAEVLLAVAREIIALIEE